MGIIMIAAGSVIILALLVAFLVLMSRDGSWKQLLLSLAVSTVVTAIATAAALLIGYGVDRL